MGGGAESHFAIASSRSLIACLTTSAFSCELTTLFLSSVFSCCSKRFWRRKSFGSDHLLKTKTCLLSFKKCGCFFPHRAIVEMLESKNPRLFGKNKKANREVPEPSPCTFVTELPDLSAPVRLSESHSDHPCDQQKLDSVPDTQKPTKGSGIRPRFTQNVTIGLVHWGCWPQYSVARTNAC